MVICSKSVNRVIAVAVVEVEITTLIASADDRNNVIADPQVDCGICNRGIGNNDCIVACTRVDNISFAQTADNRNDIIAQAEGESGICQAGCAFKLRNIVARSAFKRNVLCDSF